MEPSIKFITFFLAVLTSGLSAGFFYAWEVSVIPGTRHISDKSYLETMQSINRAILNPAFFVVFLGTLLILAVVSYMQYRVAINLPFWLVAGATFSYLAGTLGVTMLGNVPLNEALDALNLRDLSTAGLHDFRKSFESRWNLLHSIRTVFSVLSFALTVLAVFVEKYHR